MQESKQQLSEEATGTPATGAHLNGVEQLDNPIWSALSTDHAALAMATPLARRYPEEIGPLAGLGRYDDSSYQALRTLARPGGLVGMFLTEAPVERQGWELVRGGLMVQMICLPGAGEEPVPAPKGVALRELVAGDVPDMVELATLTEPGPFRHGTPSLGRFYGIFEGPRLMAMAGKRTHMPGFAEISAVCTHPDARGRGYAAVLTALVRDEIRRSGKTPFLHAFAPNVGAIRVYERVGFTLRRHLHLEFLRKI